MSGLGFCLARAYQMVSPGWIKDWDLKQRSSALESLTLEFVEHLLDLFAVGGRGQGQHEQYPGFLWQQVIAGDEA